MPEVSGDAALIVDPFNVNEIAGAMQQIESDAELRNTLGTKGIARAEAFSWEKTTEKIWNGLQRIATNR
jgi:glycosyltransferase involved in cell wall biosynthesis